MHALLLLPPHNLRADCAQARGGFTGWSGGVAAAVLRAYGAMPDRFGRWKAPRGAGECGLLGNCGWIGCFSQPQCHSRYSSPFPSPLRHVFPPPSRTSLMGQPPTVAGGARHRRRRRPPSRSFISYVIIQSFLNLFLLFSFHA